MSAIAVGLILPQGDFLVHNTLLSVPIVLRYETCVTMATLALAAVLMNLMVEDR
jgi:hypothetical protein